MWLQGNGITMSLLTKGGKFGSYERKKAANPLSNLYRCKDGRWVQIMHLQPDRHWEPFSKVMGMEEYIEDPRFATMDDRTQNNTELVDIIDRQFATKSFDEWDKTFREAGDFIYSRVQEIEELQDDPQVIANDYITTFNHPALGVVKMCNHPCLLYTSPSPRDRG